MKKESTESKTGGLEKIKCFSGGGNFNSLNFYNKISVAHLDEMIDGLCEWFLSRQNTCPASPDGWFGKYGTDTIARGVAMDKMVPLRQFYVIVGIIKTALKTGKKDWLAACARALKASLDNYGDINILDYHAAYKLLYLRRLDVITWDKQKEDFILRIIDFLIQNVSTKYTFPHHVGTDPSKSHGNGALNHPAGTPTGIARLFFEWRNYLEGGLKEKYYSKITEIAEKSLQKDISAQKTSGGFPYNFNPDSSPHLIYHMSTTRTLSEIYYNYQFDIALKEKIAAALIKALDYIKSPCIKADGTFDIEKYDQSLASYFTTTYSGGIMSLTLAAKIFTEHDYGKFVDRLIEKLYTCYNPTLKSLSEQVELVETPYHKEVLKLKDFSQPRWNSYPINAQALFELSFARDFMGT